jgi:hypothetical protein
VNHCCFNKQIFIKNNSTPVAMSSDEMNTVKKDDEQIGSNSPSLTNGKETGSPSGSEGSSPAERMSSSPSPLANGEETSSPSSSQYSSSAEEVGSSPRSLAYGKEQGSASGSRDSSPVLQIGSSTPSLANGKETDVPSASQDSSPARQTGSSTPSSANRTETGSPSASRDSSPAKHIGSSTPSLANGQKTGSPSGSQDSSPVDQMVSSARSSAIGKETGSPSGRQDAPVAVASSKNKRKLDRIEVVDRPKVKRKDRESVVKKKCESPTKKKTAFSSVESKRSLLLIQEPSSLPFPPETKSLEPSLYPGKLGSMATTESIPGSIPQQFDDPNSDGNEDDAGIFDDADEDDTFEYPTYKPPPSPPPYTAPLIRPDLVDIILESPPRAKVKANIQEEDTKVEEKSETPMERKRKKQSKANRRVMLSKKEQDIAEDVLRGKIDLSRLIPEEDCRFLGETFWIFTLQQLEHAMKDVKQGLDGDPNNAVPDLSSTPSTRGDSRKDLLEKLATSNLLPRMDDEGLPESNRSKHVPSCSSLKSTVSSEVSASSDDISVDSDSDHPPTAGAKPLGNQIAEGAPAVSLATNGSTVVPGPSPAVEVSVELPVTSVLTEAGAATTPSTSVELLSKPLDNPKSEGIIATDVEEQTKPSGQGSKKRSPEESSELDVEEKAKASVQSPKKLSDHTAESIIGPKQVKAAETKLESWKEAIDRFRANNDIAEKSVDKEQFSLSGPLSCLFPVCDQRFFASVPIKYAFDFLKLKKTETGVVVDMLSLWRRQCKLADVSPLPLAKHLLGINMRLEAAIGRVPHAPPDMRAWMGCPLVVLTGAAKDFVVNGSRMYSATEFIERRTKELSTELGEWRVAKGMPALKGTGKVAMISGWKALVKEAVDVEAVDGKVISGIDFATEVQTEVPVVKEEENKAKLTKEEPEKKKRKRNKRSRGPEVEAALRSKSFLSTVFKSGKVKAMSAVGIKTAQELLEADKRPDSDLIQAMIKMRSDTKKLAGSVQPSSCVRLIYDWCQRVKARLNEMENGSLANPKPPPKPSKESEEPPTDLRKPFSKSPPSKAPPKTQGGKDQKGPWDALSGSTKVFLGSLGITSAEELLSTRTTDIANAFVLWRQERNMAILKGLGSVASVSGWKAQARKAAKAVGMEFDALAPTSNPAQSKEPKSTSLERKSQPVNLERLAIKDASDRAVLFGMPRRKFGVRRGKFFLSNLSGEC